MIHFNLIRLTKVKEYKATLKEQKDLIRSLLKEISFQEGIKESHAVSFILVDDEKIHEINLEYRHIDRPTDVISFAYGDGEDELPYELGDIYINQERVVSQAKDYGHSEKREFSYLAVHGMFHLLGYDHQTKEEEEIMIKKCEDVLTALDIRRK